MGKHKSGDGPLLGLLRRSSVFEGIFVSLLFAAAFLSVSTLIASHGVLQNTYFFDGVKSGDMFMDFFNVLKYTSLRDPYRFGFPTFQPETAYPPLAYFLLYPFSRIANAEFLSQPEIRATQFGLMALVGFLILGIVPLALMLFSKKSGNLFEKSAILAVFFTSGVFLYATERANTVFLAAFFLAAFLFGYRSENKVIRELSLLCLAAAASLKIYPAIFGLLLLKDKRYFPAARTVLYGIAMFFLPFFYFPGGLSNISLLLENVGKNTERYLFQEPTFRFGFVPFMMSVDTTFHQVGTSVFVTNLLLAAALLLCFFQKEDWKTAMLLTCAVIASPLNSAYYCGIYLFAPILLFLNKKTHRLSDWIYLICMVLILNPYQISDQNQVLITGRLANAALLFMFILLLAESIVSLIRILHRKIIHKDPGVSSQTSPTEGEGCQIE